MATRTSAALAWRTVDGVLLLDKPYGASSNAALQRARRLFGARKGGHTGTLDPFATGLLPICFGEASKFARFLLESDKGYRATLRLGVSSTTGDAEGALTVREGMALPDVAAVDAVLEAFRGVQSQRAPRHSAIKLQGKPLYEYAREGVEIEPPVRQVTLYELERLRFEGAELELGVRCSKGTYIRSLAHDIGERLGCGAYLTGLRRTSTGGFGVQDALDFEALERLSSSERDAALLASDCLVRHLPRLDLSASDAAAVVEGRQIARFEHSEGGFIRLYSPEAAFLGIGEADASCLKPFRLMATGSARDERADPEGLIAS